MPPPAESPEEPFARVSLTPVAARAMSPARSVPRLRSAAVGVVYIRQNDDWNLDEAAVRRRLSKAAKVSLAPLEESDTANVVELLEAYREALRLSGQEHAADALHDLIDDPAEHFIAVNPVTQQADPNISTE